MADAVAAMLALALNAYVLLGGADFGGGVWDLVARGPRADRQRDLIARAIGPVWEANHVWLIIAVVLLFSCFPAAFARLSIALHVPLALMLVGIVLRGSAFTFRSYGHGSAAFERRWGRAFASASLITPLLLGVTLGAVAAGRVAAPGAETRSFAAVYLWPWMTQFGAVIGLLVLICCTYLAAVYLVLESEAVDLREDFRRRAIVAWAAVLTVALVALAVARDGAPQLARGLVQSPWAVPLHVAVAASAAAALYGLWRRRYLLARGAAAAEVSLLFWGWVLAQRPYVVPPDLTIAAAAAPPATLRLVLVVLGGGSVVLVPSLYYLFRVFKGGPTAA